MLRRPTISIFQNAKYIKSDGTCALSLRVTYRGRKKYYGLPLSLSKADFERVTGGKPRKEHKETLIKISVYINKAKEVLDSMPEFSWDGFERNFFSDRASRTFIFPAIDEYIRTLKSENRFGTASSYQSSLNSLKQFHANPTFLEIDTRFLNRYEEWMHERGKSPTTIGIYLRSMRKIFNHAIQNKFIPPECYPFGRGKYVIPTSRNPKRALSSEDIKKIISFEFESPTLKHRSRDIWVFMFYAYGMNMKDVALLTYESISGGYIYFEREKTKKTKRATNKIKVQLIPPIQQIIEKWGNVNEGGKTYIFPILNKGMNLERQRKVIQQATKLTNKHMQELGNTLGIEAKISTQTARHSFATTMMRAAMPTQFITNSLGHTNSKTTQNYLSDFEDESYLVASKVLNSFCLKNETAKE
jgi:integrase/recombinase XerD